MGRNLNMTLVRSIRLSLERDELNAQLEQRVAERTAELDRMLGQLAEEVAERESAERGLRVMADALPVQLAFVDTNLRYRFSNDPYANQTSMVCKCCSNPSKAINSLRLLVGKSGISLLRADNGFEPVNGDEQTRERLSVRTAKRSKTESETTGYPVIG